MLRLSGKVHDVQIRNGQTKSGKAFQTAECFILQEGERFMPILKCDVEKAPKIGENIDVQVRASGWQGRNGVNVDFYLLDRES